MNRPAVPPDRRAGHFLSLLPWTARDLEPILERAASFPRGELRDRSVLFLSRADPDRLAAEDLWQAVLEAGGRALVAPFPEADAALPAGAREAAVWVVDPPEPSALAALLRTAPRPVASLRSAHNDPLRALCDYAALRRLLGEQALRVHWKGAAGPRLHGWVELSTRFAMEFDVELEGDAEPDPAVVAFARVRAKGGLHLPARPGAAARAGVLLWRQEPGALVAAGAVWVPVDGPPPWPRAWDRAVAGGLLEELVRRWESSTSKREGR